MQLTSATGDKVSQEVVQSIFEWSRVLLVDGLDEVQDAGTLEDFIRQLSVIVEFHPDATVVVTSRPISGGPLVHLGFDAYEISSLDKEQALELHMRWTKLMGHSATSDQVTYTSTEGKVVYPLQNPLFIAFAFLFPGSPNEVAPRLAVLEQGLRALLEDWPRRRGYSWRTAQPMVILKRLAVGLQTEAGRQAKELEARIRKRREIMQRGEEESSEPLYEWSRKQLELKNAQRESSLRSTARSAKQILEQSGLDGLLGASMTIEDALSELSEQSGILVLTPDGGFAFAHRLLQELICALHVRDQGIEQMRRTIFGRTTSMYDGSDFEHWEEIRLLLLEVAAQQGWLDGVLQALIAKDERLTTFRLLERGVRVTPVIFEAALSQFCARRGFTPWAQDRLHAERWCLRRIRGALPHYRDTIDLHVTQHLKEANFVREHVLRLAQPGAVRIALETRSEPGPVVDACVERLALSHIDELSDEVVIQCLRKRAFGWLDHDSLSFLLDDDDLDDRRRAVAILRALLLGHRIGELRAMAGQKACWRGKDGCGLSLQFDEWLWVQWEREMRPAYGYHGPGPNGLVMQVKSFVRWIRKLIGRRGTFLDRVFCLEHEAKLRSGIEWMSIFLRIDQDKVLGKLVFSLLCANALGGFPNRILELDLNGQAPRNPWAQWLQQVMKALISPVEYNEPDKLDLGNYVDISEALRAALMSSMPIPAGVLERRI